MWLFTRGYPIDINDRTDFLLTSDMAWHGLPVGSQGRTARKPQTQPALAFFWGKQAAAMTRTRAPRGIWRSAKRFNGCIRSDPWENALKTSTCQSLIFINCLKIISSQFSPTALCQWEFQAIFCGDIHLHRPYLYRTYMALYIYMVGTSILGSWISHWLCHPLISMLICCHVRSQQAARNFDLERLRFV